jgi:hypothetical protein
VYARRAAAALKVREAAVMSAVTAEHKKNSQAATREAGPKKAAEQVPGGARATHEREVLRKLFEYPRVLGGAADTLTPEAFSMGALGELYREMLNAWDEYGELVDGAMTSHLSPEGLEELQRVRKDIPTDQSAPVDAEGEERRLISELQKLAAGAKEQGRDLAALRQRKGQRKARKA